MKPVGRNPGLALVFSQNLFSVPRIFAKVVEKWGVHETVVFITIRQLPIPYVHPEERLLLAALDYSGFYRCVARFGYLDEVDLVSCLASEPITTVILNSIKSHQSG